MYVSANIFGHFLKIKMHLLFVYIRPHEKKNYGHFSRFVSDSTSLIYIIPIAVVVTAILILVVVWVLKRRFTWSNIPYQ